MPLYESALIALILSACEFLPIPGIAHLEVISKLTSWDTPDPRLIMAIHAGCLLGVVFYYLSDLLKIGYYTYDAITHKRVGPVTKIGVCLILATLPAAALVIILGRSNFFLHLSIDAIAYATIGFGVLLGLSSYVNHHLVWRNILNIEGERKDSLRHMSYQQAITIGLSQICAFIPGASRYGVAFTAGLFIGIRPEASARFSAMLAIPSLIAMLAIDLTQSQARAESYSNVAQTDYVTLGFAGILSMVMALGVLHLFVKYLGKHGTGIFVAYRILLGSLLLFLFH